MWNVSQVEENHVTSRHRPNPLEHILSQSKFNAGLA